MRLNIGKWTLYEGTFRRILYLLCFCFLCVIDQRVMTGHPNDGTREVFRDLTGVCLAIVILSHYKWEDVVKYKRFYIGWSVLAGIGLPLLFVAGKGKMPFLADWIVMLVDVFIWGYVVIAVFSRFFIEKKRPKLNRKAMAAWVLMMLLMICSRSDLWWPACYLVMFGCFYLTDFEKAEREDLLQGALSGMILSFFLFQGLSFLYRPFDQVRYVGWYTNCNNNALYYLSVLAAVLTKLCCAARHGRGKWLKAYYFLGTGVVLSFVVLTLGRAAWIAAFAMLVFTLYFLCRGRGKKAYLKNGMILTLCVCLTFLPCFAAARYIPALRHHPIWFFGEWSEEKVHSWDPWDSEKYVDIDEFLEAAGGRVAESVFDLFNHMMPSLKVQAAQESPKPLIADGEYYDYVIIRGSIYKYFWNDLNWRGHKNEEVGFQLLSHYWIGHAHNIFLQFGTNFGIPVMILFAILLVWTLIYCMARWREEEDAAVVGSVLWMFIPLLFGMFEFCWGAGSLTLFMIFFSWRNAFWEKA